MSKKLNEQEKAFLLDLKALLAKYEAEVEVVDEWTGYAECGQDLQLQVYSQGTPKEGWKDRMDLSLGQVLDQERIEKLLS